MILPKPLWLLAELSYACPLQCSYCSNPINFATISKKDELNTEEWQNIFTQARSLGAVQLGLSGGEPLLRHDLEKLISTAHHLGFYTNLITSGLGADKSRIRDLKRRGLDAIQLSMQWPHQSHCPTKKDKDFHLHKIGIAQAIKEIGFPLILNIVLHRYNIDLIQEFLELALNLNADYLELANTQYYGFAHLNRLQLLASQEQIERAEDTTRDFRKRHPQMKIYFVASDYAENKVKACMNGWAKIFLTVTPDGFALPCHSARLLRNIAPPDLRQQTLRWAWEESPLFNKFRGFNWMKEPCASCPQRFEDFGGCRCQAFLLSGDAANTDPVCSLAPHHQVVTDIKAAAQQEISALPALIARNSTNSRLLTKNDGAKQ